MIKSSDLVTFFYCKRKLFLKKRLNINKKQSIQTEIVEEALRLSNSSDQGITRSFRDFTTLQKIIDIYRKNLRRCLQEAIIKHKEKIINNSLSIIDLSKSAWAEMQPYINMKAIHVHKLMTEQRLLGDELWWGMKPKIRFKEEIISEKNNIRVIIDRTDYYSEKEVIPWLIKKMNAPEKPWTSHKIELAAAMMTLAEKGFIVQEGIIGYSSGQEKQKMILTPEIEEKTIKTLTEIREITEKNELPARITNEQKCEKCSFREKCFNDQYIASLLNNIKTEFNETFK